MSNMKTKLIVLAVLGGLGVVGSLMNSRQAAAAGGTSVTIEGPLPLPVTGSVEARQSGAWNVGINGTPSVNVANSASAPLLSVNLSDAGRTPYQSQISQACGSGPCVALFPVVPSGRRLVVQHFSADVSLSGVPSFVSGSLGVLNGTPATTFTVSPAQAFAFDEPVLVYCDGGQTPLASVLWTPIALIGGVNFSLTGYMVDCGIAPCAPIAR